MLWLGLSCCSYGHSLIAVSICPISVRVLLRSSYIWGEGIMTFLLASGGKASYAVTPLVFTRRLMTQGAAHKRHLHGRNVNWEGRSYSLSQKAQSLKEFTLRSPVLSIRGLVMRSSVLPMGVINRCTEKHKSECSSDKFTRGHSVGEFLGTLSVRLKGITLLQCIRCSPVRSLWVRTPLHITHCTNTLITC